MRKLAPWLSILTALVCFIFVWKPIQVGEETLPTWQILKPAGQQISFGGRPVDMVIAPDGKTVYVKDDRGLVVLTADSWKLKQELKFEEGGGSMTGIAANPAGTRVYATTAQDLLCEAKVEPDGQLVWERKIRLPGPGGQGNSHACGIALNAEAATAYVCLSRNNSLAVVDLKEGKLLNEIPVGIAPFGVVLSTDGKRAYVSNWGGRKPKEGERKTESSGSDVLVDERGVANSGTVSVVDLETGREIAQIEVGLHPCGLALSKDGKRLYVANANSDTVSVVDAQKWQIAETINVRPKPDLPFGSMPNALALSEDGKTLYVANGGNNAVAVIALPTVEQVRSRVHGFIPAGWYPGAVAVHGKTLYIANIKGVGSRNKQANRKGWHVYWALGTVNKVPVPNSSQLARYTSQVQKDSRIPQILKAHEKSVSGKKPVPVPAKLGEPSVFEHVVYIIKENRTYDQLFGDLKQADGDPELCIFGRQVTPNHHALAEQFVLLDNYYCNGVNSADGHAWSTEGNVTGYLERSFGGFTRTYVWGDDPLSYSASGFIWDGVLMAGLSFRNYGEMDYAEPVPVNASWEAIYKDYKEKTNKITFTQNIGIETLKRYSHRDYPGWNMDIPDVLRADRFIQDLRDAESKGEWVNFAIIFLPNDHTSGTQPGAPTPRAQVADNDLALGRIVEAITKSKFWRRTCIFVIEDDPQDGFDHVDGHRSICLIISPYTKRGVVISEFYNQTAVLHTMQRMLGVPPMNQMNALAPLMTACFTDKPDYTPFTALPNEIPLDEMNPALNSQTGHALYYAQKSKRLPLEKFDMADEDLMNRILWHSVKGYDISYPSHLAGAHGKGLKGRKLIHEEKD